MKDPIQNILDAVERSNFAPLRWLEEMEMERFKKVLPFIVAGLLTVAGMFPLMLGAPTHCWAILLGAATLCLLNEVALPAGRKTAFSYMERLPPLQISAAFGIFGGVLMAAGAIMVIQEISVFPFFALAVGALCLLGSFIGVIFHSREIEPMAVEAN